MRFLGAFDPLRLAHATKEHLVELFGRVTPALREGVECEAEAMGRFLGVGCDARFSSG